MTDFELKRDSLKEEKRKNKANEEIAKSANRIKEAEYQEKAKMGKFQRVKGGFDMARDSMDSGLELAKVIGGFVGKAGKTGKGQNDPSWYNLDPQLVKDTANVSYWTPTGTLFPNASDYAGEGTRPSAPGILKLNWVPSIGSPKSTSGIQVITRSLYAYIRHANSGSANYSASSYVKYLMAMDSAYTVWAKFTRIYGVARRFDTQNKYYNEALLLALGADPDDVRENLADFRQAINVFRLALNSFYVPADLNYFKRHIWMESNIFKDFDIAKSQLYVLDTPFYGVYEIPDQETTARIAFKVYRNSDSITTTLTVAEMKKIMDSIITSLYSFTDIGIMSGDTKKAFGTNLHVLPEITESYVLDPVYSQDILEQIHGACGVGTITPGMVDIKESANGIDLYQGEASAADNTVDVFSNDQFLTGTTTPNKRSGCDLEHVKISLFHDNVEPINTMYATRLTNCIKLKQLTAVDSSGSGSNTLGLAIYASGSEIMTDMHVYVYELVSSEPALNDVKLHYITMSTTSNNMLRDLNRLSNLLSPFDWAPGTKIIGYTSLTTQSVNWVNEMRDFANYAIIDRDVVANIHRTALLSLFAVPSYTAKR